MSNTSNTSNMSNAPFSSVAPTHAPRVAHTGLGTTSGLLSLSSTGLGVSSGTSRVGGFSMPSNGTDGTAAAPPLPPALALSASLHNPYAFMFLFMLGEFCAIPSVMAIGLYLDGITLKAAWRHASLKTIGWGIATGFAVHLGYVAEKRIIVCACVCVCVWCGRVLAM